MARLLRNGKDCFSDTLTYGEVETQLLEELVPAKQFVSTIFFLWLILTKNLVNHQPVVPSLHLYQRLHRSQLFQSEQFSTTDGKRSYPIHIYSVGARAQWLSLCPGLLFLSMLNSSIRKRQEKLGNVGISCIVSAFFPQAFPPSIFPIINKYSVSQEVAFYSFYYVVICLLPKNNT